MGTDYRPQEKKAFGSFRKVSKPLMEKKRRARINVSLEQLKALLEKHYSHQIQKRKLEKADILELSVKYMKSLQRSIQGAPLTKSADYQAGFRSCLQGVRQFLLRSEAASEANSFQLLHELARALPGGVGVFSTMDSGPVAVLPEVRLTALGGAGAPGPPFPVCGKGRPLKAQARARGSEDTTPSGGSRIQARSERGQRAQALPERDEQLWRPWKHVCPVVQLLRHQINREAAGNGSDGENCTSWIPVARDIGPSFYSAVL